MPELLNSSLPDAVRKASYALDDETGYDALRGLIGDAALVLLGEETHGTHEFYRARDQITRRLIEQKGFTAVAVEADWPDAYRVNSYVHGLGNDRDPEEALRGFQRFPAWMWRNLDVAGFVFWLRSRNDRLPAGAPKAGFYGLDLYSLYSSIEAVLAYLDKVDPEAARRARYRYACFEHFGEDTEAYGYAAGFNLSRSCEDDVVNQLRELQSRAMDYARRDGVVAAAEFFYAEQNARVVRNAEAYYRSMFRGRTASWNLRDRHMAETLDALIAHLSRQRGEPVRIIVWAHNSHVGDARATEMGDHGELNAGQLVRERHGQDAVLIGFSTYDGTVTAASDWGGPAERKRVRPALSSSYEALFHDAGLSRSLVALQGAGLRTIKLREPWLQRAIGVIYRPKTERLSHYFLARLSGQFDAVLHFDHTHAVEPLERTTEWEAGEMETFPTGV